MATSPTSDTPRSTPARVWAGRIMSGLVVVFMVMASAFPKFFLPQVAAEAMRQLAWPEKRIMLLAIIELTGTVLYAVPRTAALGAIVLTGLFGGAIASHLRVDAPRFSHTLFPLYVGVLTWGGLWLRSARLRQIVPLMLRD